MPKYKTAGDTAGWIIVQQYIKATSCRTLFSDLLAAANLFSLFMTAYFQLLILKI
jgi:hypothetical protein